MIWGPPGVGKSDVVAAIGQELDLEVRDFRIALLDPTDVKGFPMPDAKTKSMIYYRDAQLPTKGRGLLFLDEINAGTPATQAAYMQLTLGRRIGDYVLPDGWDILAAGNRESDRSVVNRMPTALAKRFVHLDFEVSLDDWAVWAIENDIISELIGFMRFRTNLLHSFDPSKRSSPDPRSWAKVNKIIKAGLPPVVEFGLVSGMVGEGAASELTAYLQVYKDLPTIDQIVLNPDTVPVPTKPATLFALATALGEKAKRDTFDRLMQYVERMPIEFQVVTVRDAVRRTGTISSTKAFTNWGIKNAAVAM